MQIDRETILQAKEKLGDRNAQIIVEELGITDFDEKNMKCCCPFHQEDHASFIYNKKAFNFRCFGSCGRSYDILDVFMYKGATYRQDYPDPPNQSRSGTQLRYHYQLRRLQCLRQIRAALT